MAVAYAMGKTLNPGWASTRFWVLTVLCCLLPDVDVLGLVMGIPYDHVLGHRGITHSVVFAIMVGIVMPRVLTSGFSCSTYRYSTLAVYFSLVTLSHGVLDALTDGGLGIAFFAPFDATRYFFPWRPIAVSPIGISEFVSLGGLRVLLIEGIWIGIPVGLWLGILQVVRREG